MKGRLLLFCLFFSVHAYSQNYAFHNFTSEEGLAQPYVYSIIQDSRGYLWLGTGNGLSRYNGFKFDNYSTSDSLADNFINCGINDGDRLWFGCINGRISYYDGKKFHTVKIPQPIGSPITHFIKRFDGTIWISTYSDGLLEVVKKGDQADLHPFNESMIITSFDFLNEQELIVGSNAGLFACKIQKSGKIDIIKPVREIPGSKVTSIKKINNSNGFYITTENDGIFILLPKEGNQFVVSKMKTEHDTALTGIQEIFEDSHANLWLCSFGHGLIKLICSDSHSVTSVEYFNKANGFVTDYVKTVFEDREGNIWSGNYGEGLTQIEPKIFSVSTNTKGLFGYHVFSMSMNGKSCWIGTDKGLIKFNQLSENIIRIFDHRNGIPNDTITSIFSTDGQILWIGTDKNGIFRMNLKNEKISSFRLGDDRLQNSITCISGIEKQLWIGTKKGLCNVNSETNRIQWYTISQGGLPHNYINCLFTDHTGKLWVTTHSNVIAYIKEGKVTKIPLNFSSGILNLGPVTEDSESRIWVGSDGNGVFRIKSDSVINLTTKEGLMSDYCYSMICDDYKNIWVGHKGGLTRIRMGDFSMKPIQHFDGNTDHFNFNPNAIAIDSHHTLWFGSDHGLISYDPTRESRHFLSPVLGITSLKINDEEKEVKEPMILSPGKYKIRIEFLGISLKEPELVTYQYRLEGYDQWSGITKNNIVTYNQVSDGEYSFIVNASSGDGTVTEKPLILHFIIQKPIWKIWWSYFIIAVILFTLIIGYVKRREYRFMEENRILEKKVNERTFEILCQKNEIELQRDLIERKNDNITSSINYARHIQTAVLPFQEFIDKLLPESFILNKPKDIVSGDFYWLAEKENKIIFTVADCTGHGVPGAFMSLLGITLLNEIVNIEGITNSAIIVMKLREKLILSLQQTKKNIDTPDGMDIALCVLDPKQNKIQYSGAMNNLVFFRDGILHVVKSNHISVSALVEDSGDFTLHEFEYKKGDVFYIFSDGYIDQFGGEYNKKFLRSRFYNLISEVHTLPIKHQKEVLEQKIHEWMKDNSQTDDITVMGVRIS